MDSICGRDPLGLVSVRQVCSPKLLAVSILRPLCCSIMSSMACPRGRRAKKVLLRIKVRECEIQKEAICRRRTVNMGLKS